MNPAALKKRQNLKSANHPSNPFSKSIKRIEERPDLNNFVTGKALNINTEQPVLKPSLAEHLANPYIYIKKVIDKNKAREYSYNHHADWNTSCNPASLQRPRTARPHDEDFPSPRDERSQSPENEKRSPEKNNRNARQEQYHENANLRTFVQQYFDNIHDGLWARQSQIEARETEEKEKRAIRPQSANAQAQEENINPYDLREKFNKFAKLRKLNFAQNDEDKFISQGVFKEFIKYLQTGAVKPAVERRRDDSPGAKKAAESPSERPKRSAGGPSSPTKKPEKKIEEFEEERDNGEPDEVAERFFRSFAEVKGTPTLGKSEKISIKAFMFNYKKHVENKHKIRYLLSEKASKQRNADIKIYIRDYLAAFDDIKAHLHQIKEKQANVYSAIVAYDMAGRAANEPSIIDPYNRIIEDKDRLNFERKVLVRFLELRNKRNPDTLIELHSLQSLMNQVILQEKSQDLTMLGSFIHEFKREKQLFKEDQFNIFEMVNFIHEKKYSRSQFEIISYFIEALKKAYNLSKAFPKDQYVDPRTSFTNSFLSSVFDRLCNKAHRQSEIVEKLIKDLEEEFERYRQPEATNRTNKIIEHNVLGDFILRRFSVLDNHLLEVFDRLEEVGNYMTQEEIDQIPMEEVRGRVYFILTGEEIRKEPESPNTKKLEGLARLLKAANKPEEKEREKRSALPPGSTGSSAGLRPTTAPLAKDSGIDLKGLNPQEREKVQRLLQEKERIERELAAASGVKEYQPRNAAANAQQQRAEEEDRVNRLLRDREDKANQVIYDREREEALRIQREKDIMRQHEVKDYKEKARKEKEEWDWEAALDRKQDNDSFLKQSEVVNSKDKDEDLDLIDLLNDKKPEPARRNINDILGSHSKYDNNPSPTEAIPSFPKYQKVLDSGFVSGSSWKEREVAPVDVRRETGESFHTQERFRNTSEKKVLFQDDPPARNTRGGERESFRENAPEFRSSFLDSLKGLKMIEESQRFETPEHIKNSIMKKNETLSKELEDCKDANFLTKSTLKGRTDDAVLIPDTVNFGKDKPKMGRFSDYEMLLPSDYYAFLARKNVEMDKDPWYIRSHHIETLTEHPKSVKDNILGAEYMSYYSALPKDTALSAKEKEIVGYGDKESLIKSLEENRRRLKEELDSKQGVRDQRKTMSTADIQNSKGFKEVSKYYDTREVTQGPNLMVKAYEGILDDLRAQEKDLLNTKRESELKKLKPPPHKWWELKDKTFIDEYVKHVFMTNSEPNNVDTYLKYVEELQMRELI